MEKSALKGQTVSPQNKIIWLSVAMEMHIYDPSAWEADARGLPNTMQAGGYRTRLRLALCPIPKKRRQKKEGSKGGKEEGEERERQYKDQKTVSRGCPDSGCADFSSQHKW